MVFLTSSLLRRITFVQKTPGPDRFWRRRKIFQLSAHFRGRSQNCYTLAVQYVRRALRAASFAKDHRTKDQRNVLTARLTAACEEHGFDIKLLKEALVRSNILLSQRVLCDLAIWEPRTFKSITDFAWNKAKSEGLKGVNDLGDPPAGVILKHMIIK